MKYAEFLLLAAPWVLFMFMSLKIIFQDFQVYMYYSVKYHRCVVQELSSHAIAGLQTPSPLSWSYPQPIAFV